MDEQDLVGEWEIEPQNLSSGSDSTLTTVYFGRDGKLAYVIHEATRDAVVRLTYRVSGNMLITNQLSAPQEERTLFEITPDGRLILSFGGKTSRYVKLAG